MIADKAALRVTPSQHRQLAHWSECVRLTYNWALSEWRRQYADYLAEHAASEDPASSPPKPSLNGIVHLFTVLRKAGRLPSWAHAPLALTRNRAVRDVDRAWRNHFAGRSGRPRPKRRADPPSFYLHNQSVRFEGEFAEVQKIGSLRLARAPRYPRHPVQGATVSYEHGRWHIAIVRDLDRQRQRAPAGAVGLHVGAKAAVSSDGARLLADVTTDAERRRLRRLQRTLSRRGIESPHGRLRASRGGRAIRVSPSRNRIKSVQRLNAFRGAHRPAPGSAAARLHAIAGRSIRRRMRGDGRCGKAGTGRRTPPARPEGHARRFLAARAAPAARVQAGRARRQARHGRGRPDGGSLLRVRGADRAARAGPIRAAGLGVSRCGAVNDSDINAAAGIARQATANDLGSGASDTGTTPSG